MELQKENGFTIVASFGADWCGPCKALAPILNDYAENCKSIVFLKIDIDKCHEIASKYNVSSVPTTFFIRSDGSTQKIVGINRKYIEQKIMDELDVLQKLKIVM